MKLIVMRHGQASWSAPNDQERPLTEVGQQEVLSTASKLTHLGISRVLASPYLRAQQSGRILAETLECTLETLDCITPDADPMAVISELPVQGNIALASHMPLVGALTSLLCEGAIHQGPGFMTGNAAVLEMELPGPGLATLIEMVAP
ncbi:MULTISPECIES: phosphohistidine phosphatase SixA [unclassified Endozoicomonas]|uniref:phosphohistidine phosphatase SixA n=1 Tax=unclassified Endozoicomonas TaxID=2644528 RepID=UPI0021475769|nr:MULTISPECIES: phosphohistidine phosphatase SixA [unclassified Endozoicomonas]